MTQGVVSLAEAERRRRFRAFIADYHAARAADLAALEAATAMYASEVADYIAEHGPPMVLKRWLIESAGLPR